MANRIQHLKDEVAKAAGRTREAGKRAKVVKGLKQETVMRQEKAMELKPSGEKKVIEDAGYFGTWIPGGLQGPKKEFETIHVTQIIKIKRENVAALLAKNKQKIEEVKKKRIEMAAAKRKAEASRIAGLKAQYQKKMAAERARREAADEAVGVLEEEERRLIEVLREQQEEQRIAYVALTETIVGE